MALESDILMHIEDGITVRQWRNTDAAPISRHGTRDEVWNNLRNRMPHPYTEADAAQWIAFCHDKTHHVRSGDWTAESGSQGPAVPTNYAVVVDGEAVGGIGLDLKDDVYFRSAELGYWLGPDHWGKGVMSKVVPAFVQWTWETFGILIRINGEINGTNVASGKLLRKAGFTFEGQRKNAIVKNGVVGDTLMWGALRPGTEETQK